MVLPAFATDQLEPAASSGQANPPGSPIGAPACSQARPADPVSGDPPAPHASTVDRLPEYLDFEDRAVSFADPPTILRIELSDDAPHSDELLVGRVFTTTNVDSVIVRFARLQLRFARNGPGEFRLGYVVPDVPFFLKRTYTVSVLAVTADGRTTSVDAPFSLR